MPTIPKEKVQVVYPPCDVDSQSISNGGAVSRKQRPVNERYVFLSMNRFWPEKRLDIILEAAGMPSAFFPPAPLSLISFEIPRFLFNSKLSLR